MGYKVVMAARAERALANLPTTINERIAEAIRSLYTYTAPTARIEKLKKPLTGYRRRVGDYRILTDIEDDTIVIHDIKHRKDAYR